MRPTEANDNVIAMPNRAELRRAQREFLPAALEILETPASPTGRAVAWTIMLFFVLALAWSVVGEIDIITTAQGKVVPTGRTKVIQPFETGVVRAIRVEDGQAVKAGDVLIELDPTINTAERDKNAKDLMAARLEIARLTAALAGADDPTAPFEIPQGASMAQAAMQRSFLSHQLDEFRAKIANFDRQIAQNESKAHAIAATIAKLEATIPLIKEREVARKYLSDKSATPRLQYLQDKQDLLEHQNELDVQKAWLAEAEAAVGALKEQRRQANAEFRRNVFNDLTQATQKAESLAETLAQSEQRKALQTLTASVDGTVQQLAIHTLGGVVTPAQQLMVIVPAGSTLEIEAMVPNRDIGFVQPGQQAEIKIDTFNFTRYGLLHGAVLSVSQDAIVRDKPASSTAADATKSFGGALGDTSEPQGQELLYAAHISLDRVAMRVEERTVNLTPGMAVTAEIKTGQRKVIEYLLSPLVRYGHESMRER